MENSTTQGVAGSNCSVASTSVTEAGFKAAAYFFIMLVAFLGNSLLIRVIVKTRRMRTAINHLIVSMAVSDLLTTMVTMAIETYVYISQALSRTTTWVSGVEGVVLCKFNIFVQGVAMASSVLTLVAIAMNRFLAVVYPLRSSQFKHSSVVAIVVIWVVSCILVSPMLYVATVKLIDGSPYCGEEWGPPFDSTAAPEQYTLALFGFLYACPLIVISTLYFCVVYKVWMRQVPGNVTAPNQQLELQTKKRVLKMLITVVVVFVLCWLPYYVYLMVGYFVYDGIQCELSPQYFFFGLFLGHTNSAINPCIYVIFNRDFRLGFQEIFFTCCFCCRNNTNASRAANSRYASFRSSAMQPLNLTTTQSSPSVSTRRASRSSRVLRSSPIMRRRPLSGHETGNEAGYNTPKQIKATYL